MIAPEKIWIYPEQGDPGAGEWFWSAEIDEPEASAAISFTRTDLSQASVAAALETAVARIADICPHADVPGGNTVPNTFDEGTSAAFEVVNDLITDTKRTALQAAIDAAKAEARAEDAVKIEHVRHIKRGSTYSILGRGKVQTDTPLPDYAEVVIYQSDEDGMIWVRPVSEFEDGRFAQIGAKT